MPAMVASKTPMESPTCHHTGICTATRVNIIRGEVSGKIEAQKAIVELGYWITLNMMTRAAAKGITARNCNCCASCSEFTIAPMAA